jgi:hypothetical protein
MFKSEVARRYASFFTFLSLLLLLLLLLVVGCWLLVVVVVVVDYIYFLELSRDYFPSIYSGESPDIQ